MARSLTPTAIQLETLTAPATATPLTMGLWFNTDFSQTLLSIRDSDGSERFQIQANDASNTVQAVSIAAGVQASAVTTAGFTDNQWHHACGVFAASNSRSIYLDGGNKQTNTTSNTPGTVDRTRINNFTSAKSLLVAEAAIWNVALSDAEVALLAKRVSPLMVRADALVAYWPLIGNYSPEIDIVGGHSFTVVDAVAAAHPRIYYPVGPHLGLGMDTHLSGVVTLDGVAVEGAFVYAMNQTSQTVYGPAETDGAGAYSIAVPPGDLYHVFVEYEDAPDLYNALSKWNVEPITA